MTAEGGTAVLGRKKAVSLRLHVADLKKIKKISERLGVRDSDVIRYAVKCLLVKLSPISDPAVRGRHLVPVFLEMGRDLTHGFDIDAARLHEILNEGASPEECVGIDLTEAGQWAVVDQIGLGDTMIPEQLSIDALVHLCRARHGGDR